MSTNPAESAPSARRQQTRERLLDAAIEVFAEDGLQGAAVESICARAGFTRGAFYSNFSSKEQLFLVLLEREFERRAEDLAMKAQELKPTLRERSGCVSHTEAAKYVAEFFTPADDATAWFVLEVEFLLLALRDPSIAPGHHEFMDRFYASIAGVIEQVIAAAGRRFVIPAERALPVLSSVYEQAIRASALAGPEASGVFDRLGDRIAELLFAITEEIDAGEDVDAAADAGAAAGARTRVHADAAAGPSSRPDPAPDAAASAPARTLSPGFEPPKKLRLF